MKVKTTVYIHYQQFSWEQEGRFFASYVKHEDTEYATYVNEQDVEIEVPDDYDPRAQKVAALQARKLKVMADYQKTVDEINERISKLQALEYAA